MIEFAVRYRAALDMITSDRDMGLRDYEMSREEWEIAGHLVEVLKVGSSALLTWNIASLIHFYSLF
jgi:hypothetical protein